MYQQIKRHTLKDNNVCVSEWRQEGKGNFIYKAKVIVSKIMYHRGRDIKVYNISFFFFFCLFFCGISIDQFNLELLIIVIFSTLARGGFFIFCVFMGFLRVFTTLFNFLVVSEIAFPFHSKNTI